MESSVEVQVARLDERVVGLDQKIETHNAMSMESHAKLASELREISQQIRTYFDRNDDKMRSNTASIEELKRDRTWMFGVFSVLWATVVAYFKHEMGKWG